MLRERTLGNSPTSLMKKLQELHSEEWLERLLRYLNDCKAVLVFAPHQVLQVPPPPHPLPNPRWLMSVYLREVMDRKPETLAGITSVTGEILKMDATKKVTYFYACFYITFLKVVILKYCISFILQQRKIFSLL